MARRRKPADSPPRQPGDGGAIILQGRGAAQGPATRAGEGAGVQVEGDALVLDLDARALVDGMRRAMLAESREQIREGKRPDGGAQRPLSRRAAADPKREAPVRGVRTGHMIDDLEATPIRGSATSAESEIKVPGDRVVFQRAEAQRGVHYLGVGARHVAAGERAVGEMLDAMLDGKRVEAEQGTPLAKNEGQR